MGVLGHPSWWFFCSYDSSADKPSSLTASIYSFFWPFFVWMKHYIREWVTWQSGVASKWLHHVIEKWEKINSCWGGLWPMQNRTWKRAWQINVLIWNTGFPGIPSKENPTVWTCQDTCFVSFHLIRKQKQYPTGSLHIVSYPSTPHFLFTSFSLSWA